MQPIAESAVLVDDLRVAERGVGGGLHVRRWCTDGVAAASGRMTPIMLLHDSLGCVALWRDFPERLARATGRDVIAYDRLGFGQSDPHAGRLPASFVFDEAGDGFRRVREALGVDRFIAFGHSVGGGMAVACAAAYPQACRALVTVSAQAFVEDRTLAGIRAAREGFTQPGQVERLARYHGDKTAWVLSAWIGTWLSPDFADWSLDEVLPQVRCPALVVHGSDDEFGSERHPRRIAAGVAGPSTLQWLEGVGHVPHREQPDRLLVLFAAWLAELSD